MNGNIHSLLQCPNALYHIQGERRYCVYKLLVNEMCWLHVCRTFGICMNYFVGSLYRTQDVLGIGGELYLPALTNC